jgi:Tfp pilus assembly PilM family ATPase
MLSILVIAAQREMVEGLVGVARKAGLQVLSIDLQAFGLVRAAFGSGLTMGGDGPQGLLDIGGSMSQIAVVRGGSRASCASCPPGAPSSPRR